MLESTRTQPRGYPAASKPDDNLPEDLEEAAQVLCGLDRTIHEPSKLAILTIIRSGAADYLRLKRLTGLSKGNLSNHLAKLEKTGLVAIGKHFEHKKPVTTVSLTEEGRTAIETYWTSMRRAARITAPHSHPTADDPDKGSHP